MQNRSLRIAGIALLLALIAGAGRGAEQASVEYRHYKRAHRPALRMMNEARYASAAGWCERFLQAHPGDPEALFLLTAARTQTGDLRAATNAAERALEAGLPAGRLLAGPRAWLSPLHEHPAFRELVEPAPAIVHGPMLGAVTANSARIWVRTARAATVQAMVTPPLRLQGTVLSETVRTSAETDFTAVLDVGGLLPSTRYHYRLSVDGETVGAPRSRTFRTYPARGQSADFLVGFGGGAGYNPPAERIWKRIADRGLRAFLFLGDNVYIDMPRSTPAQRYKYYRRQSRPEFRRLTASTPIYAIWDDHDFATDNSWGGPEVDDPPWKRDVWRVFRQNWNNPAYGGGPQHPGCYFRFSIADVDFFMLDGRYYRTAPDAENLTMLGPVQKRWLLEGLRESDATFKVLASPVPWALETKGKSPDTWRGYAGEREEIFSFLHENRIEGVVLISADRHRADIWRIERDAGYALYEFENSRLTNQHTHSTKEKALFSYNQDNCYGVLRFRTSLGDPTVTYEIRSIDGERVHSFTVPLSRLSYAE